MFSAELARLQRQVEEASNMLESERQTPQLLSGVATPLLKKNLKSISGTYVSPGSGCVGKKHSVGYVELAFGCMS